MEFEIIKNEKIGEYLTDVNPIPFSQEFQKFCELRYGATGMFVAGKLNGQLKWILPIASYSLNGMKIVEVPNAIHYTEPVLIDKNYEFDLVEIARGLFNFFDTDVVKFNIVDYHNRLIKKDYSIKFVAIGLDISSYESAEDLLKRDVSLRRRNQIRFSHKQGFSTAMLEHNQLDEFYELYKRHHQHRNYVVRGIEELRNFVVAFGDKTKILAVYSGNKIVAGILFIIDGPYLWMIINASDYGFSYYQVNNYIYWEVIKFGFANGVKYIDFGGTPVDDTGNIRFKKSLGVSLHEVYSPIYFRSQTVRFGYWFRRKKWHLKLRWRLVSSKWKSIYKKPYDRY